MKTFKIITAIFLILSLSSCVIAHDVWKEKYYREDFKEFFIDEANNRIVLIGIKDHYAIDGNTENFKNIFQLGIKSKSMEISLAHFKFGGSESSSFGSIDIIFHKEKLSKSDIKFLYQNQFSGQQALSLLIEMKKYHPSIKMTRYPASQEKIKNYQASPLVFTEFFQKVDNPVQTTGKVLITPFAAAADIIAFPFIAIALAIFGVGH